MAVFSYTRYIYWVWLHIVLMEFLNLIIFWRVQGYFIFNGDGDEDPVNWELNMFVSSYSL